MRYKNIISLIFLLSLLVPIKTNAFILQTELTNAGLFNIHTTKQFEVLSNNINIYSKSNFNSLILGKLNKETIVNVIDIQNSWATIKYKNTIGYINIQYLRKLPYNPSYYIVTTNNLNIREYKTLQSKVLSKLNKNDKVIVYRISGDWANIEFNGLSCYVSSKYLSKCITNDTILNNELHKQPVSNANIYQSKYYIVTTNNLNIRTEKSTTSSVLGSLNYGILLKPLNMSDGWAKIEYKNKIGFVNMKYLCPVIPDTIISSNLVLVNKYSALNPNYEPIDLVSVDVPYKQGIDSSAKKMRKEAAQALENMFADAQNENINLILYSGYRSFSTQKDIYSYKVKTKGEYNASLVSAKAGLSEHQTGLAVDIVSNDYMTLDSGFANTRASKWLVQNASNYGFIVRYLKDKTNITGYSFEPWHFRYVGIEAAKEISSQNLTLEEYLQKK